MLCRALKDILALNARQLIEILHHHTVIPALGDNAALLSEEDIVLIVRAELFQIALEASHVDIDEDRAEELSVLDDRVGQRRRHIVLPIGRRKGVGIREHRLHRLLRRRVPLCCLIAKERLDAVRPDKGKQTSTRIRVLRIHHLGILAVKRIRRKAYTDAEDAGCRRH